MAKSKWKQVVSPKGLAFWAKLKTQEEYKGKPTGKYSMIVKFSKEDTDRLLAVIEAEYQELKKTADCFKGVKPAKGSIPNFGTREGKDGDIEFKFTTKAEVTTKTGEVLKKTVPVFDAKGKHIDVNIGNGSTVRVSFSIAPKYIDSCKYGVSLYLDAVKVLDLVEFGTSGQNEQAFGFEEEEGYAADGGEFEPDSGQGRGDEGETEF